MAGGKLYFTAAEASGDLFAGEVIDELRAHDADLQVRGIGGFEISARAETPDIDTSALNVLGLWEGIKAYGDVRRISSEIADDIIAYKPDAVVLVDSWGLSLRVAKKVRARDPAIRLIKLIGPQVWASRAGRAKTLAQSVDHLLCMHSFEAPYYEPYGLPVTVIGQPVLARSERLSAEVFRKRQGLSSKDDLLLILPGSRGAEIALVAPVLVEAAKKRSRRSEHVKVCIAPARGVLAQFKEAFPNLPPSWMLLEDEGRRYEAMAAAQLAITCSGTVNTELAVQRTPFITGYKIGTISWVLLKTFLFKAKFITLLNMAADAMVAPEYLQDEMTAEAMADEALRLLNDRALLEKQVGKQDAALARMGLGGRSAQSLSAEAILSDLKG